MKEMAKQRLPCGYFKALKKCTFKAEDRAEVFLTIIYPVSSSRSAQQKMVEWTGLELSVGYGIVRDKDGTIGVDNINDGFRFTVMLPIVY